MILNRIINLLRSDKTKSDLERKQMAAYKDETAREITEAGTLKLKPAIKNESVLEATISPDYTILKDKFGDLESLRGKTITLELHQAAKLLNRSRIKADAFSKLIKDIKNDYGINLNIYNRRNKK